MFCASFPLCGCFLPFRFFPPDFLSARIVKEAFTRYSNGEKAKDIAEWMNAQGLKNRAGNDFGVNAFARMIRNERYTGKLREGETLYTNIIPPIIDEKLF